MACKSRISVVLLGVLIAMCGSLMAQKPSDEVRERIVDSLRHELKMAHTATDSLQLLNNLFDLARYNDRADVGEELFAVSNRHFEPSVQLDIIRRLASVYASTAPHNPERVDQLTNLVASMPQSEDQRATLAFMRVQDVVASDRDLSEAERRKRVHDLIMNRVYDNKTDPYDRIEVLFIICRYLQRDINGELLSRYLDELGNRLDEVNHDNIPLRNLYLVQASMVYTASGQVEKAIKTSRELLETIDKLDQNAKAAGLKYRNYDVNRYVALRRLLCNFRGLTNEEVEKYHNMVLDIKSRNIDVANDYDSFLRTQIYYLMANKQYAKALPLLKRAVTMKQNEAFLTQLYSYMIESARALGDKDALLTASTAYIDILQDMVDKRAEERAQEMELLEEMQNISGSNQDLQERQRRQASGYHHQLLVIVSVASILLLFVILALAYLYRKSVMLTDRLRASNEELMTERDNMEATQNELIAARDHARKADRHKTEFINNMSHEVRTPLNAIVECSHLIADNMPEDRRQYLARYADMIDVSADMLRSIVNDVLEIASMDNNSDIIVTKRQESVNAICNIAVESVKKHCQPGVVMSYLNKDCDDVTINTDASRIEQVLINILKNGAKFTEHGYVNLSYELNPDDQTITFIVEDSGIGVPKGKEEVIFERFEKLSNLTSGTGLGLNISRMIAKRLKGTVTVDTTYAGPGARFLFTIPME